MSHGAIDTLLSITKKRPVCGFELYVTVAFSPGESTPCRLFVKASKHGTEIGGLLNGAAALIIVAMENGCPYAPLRETMIGSRFGREEPEGVTSLLDALAKIVDEAIAERIESLRQETANVLPSEGAE